MFSNQLSKVACSVQDKAITFRSVCASLTGPEPPVRQAETKPERSDVKSPVHHTYFKSKTKKLAVAAKSQGAVLKNTASMMKVCTPASDTVN
jgi:hypothetical protein